MKLVDIIEVLAQKVIDTIYSEWRHEGNIQAENTDSFWFTLDGRLYKVIVEDVDCERPLTEEESNQ